MNTPTLRHLGKNQNSGWDVYSVGLQTPEALPVTLSGLSENFVCLLSWNAHRVPAKTVSAVAERLLNLGCVYFCCRGPDCERVHDIVDEVIVGDGSSNVARLDIMTTWHTNEALDETIDYFLDSACPADRYVEKCSSALAVLIGSEYETASMELGIVSRLRRPPTNPSPMKHRR